MATIRQWKRIASNGFDLRFSEASFSFFAFFAFSWGDEEVVPGSIFSAAGAEETGSAVAENAAPLSEKIISSQVPAYAVLEVNAGTVARIGLRIGDSVRHPIFGQ